MKYLSTTLPAAARWLLLRALIVALPLSAGAVAFTATAKVQPVSASALSTLATSAGHEDTEDDEDDTATEPTDGAAQMTPSAPPSSDPGGYFPGPPGEAGPSGRNPMI